MTFRHHHCALGGVRRLLGGVWSVPCVPRRLSIAFHLLGIHGRQVVGLVSCQPPAASRPSTMFKSAYPSGDSNRQAAREPPPGQWP